MKAMGERNAASRVSIKTLADCGSEEWQFYEPPSSFKIMSNAEISQKTAELKIIMHEKNAISIQKRLEAFDPMKPKTSKSREPIWARSALNKTQQVVCSKERGPEDFKIVPQV